MMLLLVVASFFANQVLGNVTEVVTSKPTEYQIIGKARKIPEIGDVIEIQSQPWLASIEHGDRHVCAASVITAYLVLTGSQCADYDKAELSVRVGCSIARRGGSVHKVKQIKRHEDFNGVALIEVEEPFEFGRDVKPISLANRGDTVDLNSTVTVAGWIAGSNLVGSMLLRSSSLRVVEQAQCHLNLTSADRICVTAPREIEAAVCQGDPGSPVVADQLQFGIVPSSFGCVSSGMPKYITNVAHYRAWIDEQIRWKFSFSKFVEDFILPSFWPFNAF